MFNFLKRKTHVVIVWNRGEQRYYCDDGQTIGIKHYADRFTKKDAESLAQWLNTLSIPAVAIRY